MEEENEIDNEMHLTKGRLEGLSDGIFAFSMTLLVLGVDLPDKATIVQSNEYAIHAPIARFRLLPLCSGIPNPRGHLALPSYQFPSSGMSTRDIRLDKPDHPDVCCPVALLDLFSGDFPGASLGAIVFDANLFAIEYGSVLPVALCDGRSSSRKTDSGGSLHLESTLSYSHHPDCNTRQYSPRPLRVHLEFGGLYDPATHQTGDRPGECGFV